MILRKETETLLNYFLVYLIHLHIRMNDTPQGDGNANVHIMNNMFKSLYKNE